jgi:hypothetical protein
MRNLWLPFNDVFMNTLADDTEYDDEISQLVRNVESGFLSDRQLRKLEKMRQDGKHTIFIRIVQ